MNRLFSSFLSLLFCIVLPGIALAQDEDILEHSYARYLPGIKVAQSDLTIEQHVALMKVFEALEPIRRPEVSATHELQREVFIQMGKKFSSRKVVSRQLVESADKLGQVSALVQQTVLTIPANITMLTQKEFAQLTEEIRNTFPRKAIDIYLDQQWKTLQDLQVEWTYRLVKEGRLPKSELLKVAKDRFGRREYRESLQTVRDYSRLVMSPVIASVAKMVKDAIEAQRTTANGAKPEFRARGFARYLPNEVAHTHGLPITVREALFDAFEELEVTRPPVEKASAGYTRNVYRFQVGAKFEKRAVSAGDLHSAYFMDVVGTEVVHLVTIPENLATMNASERLQFVRDLHTAFAEKAVPYDRNKELQKEWLQRLVDQGRLAPNAIWTEVKTAFAARNFVRGIVDFAKFVDEMFYIPRVPRADFSSTQYRATAYTCEALFLAL